MNVHAYTEDQLVEQPVIQLFAEMGWLMPLRRNLRRTRDLLLPRLISGAARSSDTETDMTQDEV